MRRTLDVSGLPHTVFGPRDPLWWGVMCLIAIESTMLVLLAVSYVYVSDRTQPFPPTHMGTGIAWVGTIELLFWIASGVPQHLSSKHAVAGNLRGMRRTLAVACLLAVIGCALRVWVFHMLPFRWDDHAYGSVVWGLLAVQWLHGLTGVCEDLVYVVLLFVGPVEDKHRVDIEASTPLVYFVIAGGVLVWAIMFLPLFLGGGR
jgi:cytochrome c oxidase subunit III